MFVVMNKQSFEFEAMSPSFHPNFEIDTGKMIGFLPVYATIEDALAEYPNAKVLEIKEVVKDA